MIAAADFKLDAIQLTGYVTQDELSPARALKLAQRTWEEIDGEIVSIPAQAGFPPEIPTAIIASESGSQRIEIARSRVNLYIISVDDQSLDFGSVAPTLANRLVAIGEDSGATFGRLAVVVTKYLLAENPGKEIAAHFFRPELLASPIKRPNLVEVHSHKVFALADDLQVNSWVRVRSAQLRESLDFVISLEQDLNTLEEERAQHAFTEQEVRKFVDLVGVEQAHIAELYFPSPPTETGLT